MKTLTAVPTSNHPFVRDLSPQHVQRLLAGASVVEFEAGEIIFREGEPANRFYLIESGKVELESRSAGCRTVRLETLHEGEALGWSWLFPSFAWRFQARAVQPTRAICCNGAQLLVEAEDDHDFGYELMKRVSQIVIHRLQASRQRWVESQAALNGASCLARC
jgi:CRP/FNR family transcriptional regulator, cyclic AMP receptor protein